MTSDTLKAKIAELNKGYGREVAKYKSKRIGKLSTGSLCMDYLMSGGYEKGSLVTFYGMSQSCKTTLGLKMLAEAQRRGETCALFRVEKGCSIEYMETLGIDTDSLLIIEDLPHMEAYLDQLVNFINEVDFILVDSITALSAKIRMDESFEKAKPRAPEAKLMSEGLKVINQMNYSTTLLFISQLREKPNPMPGGMPSYYLPSGHNTIKFYSKYMTEFKIKSRFDTKGKEVSAKLRDGTKGDVIKTGIQMYQSKCQRGVSHRVSEIMFDHETGTIDIYEEIAKLIKKLDAVKISGSYIYVSEDEKYNGVENFKEALMNDEDLMEKMTSIVRERLRVKKPNS